MSEGSGRLSKQRLLSVVGTHPVALHLICAGTCKGLSAADLCCVLHGTAAADVLPSLTYMAYSTCKHVL